jgi:hypothetical protein
MSTPAKAAPPKPASKTPPPSKPKTPRGGPGGAAVNTGSRQARRLTAAFLEVLGGARTPAEAAAAVGISLPRYYILEARALQGMIKACEPVEQGRRVSLERKVEALRKENERLRSECARYSALLRTAQRVVGLTMPSAKNRDRASKKGKRRRRPARRGLKVAERLQAVTAQVEAPSASDPEAPTP